MAVVLLLAAEIFPTKVRGRAMSLSLVSLWVWCTVVSMTFLSLTEAITITGSFWLYATMCVFAWLFIWKFVPETKDKTLEQIEDALEGEASRKECGEKAEKRG